MDYGVEPMITVGEVVTLLNEGYVKDKDYHINDSSWIFSSTKKGDPKNTRKPLRDDVSYSEIVELSDRYDIYLNIHSCIENPNDPHENRGVATTQLHFPEGTVLKSVLRKIYEDEKNSGLLPCFIILSSDRLESYCDEYKFLGITLSDFPFRQFKDKHVFICRESFKSRDMNALKLKSNSIMKLVLPLPFDQKHKFKEYINTKVMMFPNYNNKPFNNFTVKNYEEV